MTRTPSRLLRSDRAEVGVGTLIIFIAMVLVAAVAAAVIIGTSGDLQQRAQTTGQEAVQEVTSNMRVMAVYGIRNDTSSDIYDVTLQLTLSAGSSPVPLDQMIIRWSDGTQTWIYRYGESPAFDLTWVRGNGHDNVMLAGDLVEVSFNMYSTTIPPRTDFSLMLIPAVGNHVALELVTPATYATNTHIRIS